MGIELTRLRGQVSDLLRFRAKASLQRCRKFTYESGDKCGKLLARALRTAGGLLYSPYHRGRGQLAPYAQVHLPTIRSILFPPLPPAHPTCPTSHSDAVSTYLDSVPLTRLPSPAREALEAPFNSDKLQFAIKTAKTGKAPGPDGLSITKRCSLCCCLSC